MNFLLSVISSTFTLNIEISSIKITLVKKYVSKPSFPKPIPVPIKDKIYTTPIGISLLHTAASIAIANGFIPFPNPIVDIMKEIIYIIKFCLPNNFFIIFFIWLFSSSIS